MIITTGANIYKCATAEKHADGVHLLDEHGELIVILASPEDIRSVEGGEIVTVEMPKPTQADRIEAQVTYTAMITDTLLPEV